MEVLAEYHLALGELVFAYEGTLEHFAGDGLLVFFNDPVPCPDAPDRAVRMAVDMRARVAELAQGWRRKGHDLGFGVGIAQGYATLGPGRLPRPLRLRRDRHGHQPRRAAVRRWRRPTRSSSPSGSGTGSSGRWTAGEVGPWSSRASAGPWRRTRSSLCTRKGCRHERLARTTDRRSTSSTRTAATRPSTPSRRGCRRCGRRCGATTARVGGHRAVDDPGPRGERLSGMSQSLEERFLFFLLLLRQPRLRMVYVTSQPINPLIVDYYLSLLPGVIPSHARSRLSLVSVDDSGPEPLIEKVLARPRVIARIRELVPDRSLLAPRPVHHHHPRTRPRGAARHPHVRRRPTAVPARHQDRVPAAVRAGGVPLPRRGRGPAHAATTWRRRWSPCGRSGRTSGRRWSSSTRVSPVRATRSSSSQDLPAPGRRRSGRRWRARVDGMELEDTRRDGRHLPREARGARRHRRGTGRRRRAAQPERADAGDPARRGRGALDPRPGARRPERAVLPRLPVPRRPGVRAADHRGRPRGRRAAGRGGRARPLRRRLRHRAAGEGRGRPTPSRSTCARAAPPTPS